MLQKSPSIDDPLWRSLNRVVQFYHLRLDPALAQSQIAIDWSRALEVGAFVKIARHLGLEANLRATMPADLLASKIPALIVCGENTFRVLVPGTDGRPEFWDPATGVSDGGLPASLPSPLYVVQVEKREAAAADGSLLDGDSRERNLDWFWKPFWSHKSEFADVTIATFFINVFALAMPIYTKNVYDRVVPNHAEETLIALTVGIAIAFAFNLGFKLVRGYVLEGMAGRLAARLDTDLMDHLLRLDAVGQQLSVGERSDLFREMQGLRDFFAARLMPAILDLPFFILFLVVIHMIGPGLMPVVLLGVAAMFIANLACSARVNRMADNQFRETRRKNAVLVELLTGAQNIKLFNAIGGHLLTWSRISERSTHAAQRSQHVMELAGDISLTVTYLVNVFLIVVGVYEIGKGDLSVGGLVAASILVGRALAPVMTLAAVAGRLRQSLDSLKVINRIFHLPAEPRLSAAYEPKGPFTGKMELQDITYYHPGQVRPTLYHFSLSIAAGEKVGLIGRTGAGKSTVTRLLQGTIRPQTGLILTDELMLDGIHPAEWRGSLGIVPQESFFFTGSIRDNILLGISATVDEAWFQKVLELSGLHGLLQQAGYGIEFQVGEAGARLSGGQRQAIAIARALIRNPSILLLDEPTNGMDSDLEQHVRSSLAQFARDRTLILITHRTSLLPLVDRLVMVDQGRVAADGPRDEMLRRLAGEPGGAR